MPSNLYKRKGVWYGRIWVNGKDTRRSLRTGSLPTARERLKAFQEQADHLRFHGHNRSTYSAAATRWATEFLPSKRPGTAKRYLVSERELSKHFGNLYLDQINRRIIADYVSARKKTKVTNATIRRDLTALSRILGCAVAWGWIDSNPARDFDRAIVSERREAILLPAEADIGCVAGGAGTFERLVRFLQYTGMRQQEAVQLEHRDIEGAYARLTRTKTGRPRMVHLDERALGTLSGAVERMGCPYVFWITNPRTGDPGPYRNFASNFTNRVRRLHASGHISRRFRCHDLRHWYAVDYLRNGGDIYELSRELGHSSVKVTEIYLGYVGREAEPARGKERA